MNRFCKSTFSLLLATLLLFSAAGISFGMVLQSTHAYAVGPSVETPAPAPDEEDQQETSGQDEQEKPQETEQPEEQPPASTWSPQDQKINIMGEEKTSEKEDDPGKEISEENQEREENFADSSLGNKELQGEFYGISFRDSDITAKPITKGDGKLAFTVFIEKMSKNEFASYSTYTLECERLFIPSTDPSNDDLSLSLKIDQNKIEEENNGITIPISVDATSDMTPPYEVTFKLILSNETSTAILSRPIRLYTGSADERVIISSAIFKDSNNNIISRVTRGIKNQLIVTIQDYRIKDYEEYERLNLEEKLAIEINTDVFQYSNLSGENPRVSHSRDFPNGGVEYTLKFSNVRYTGENNILVLELDYDDPNYPITWPDRTLNQCEIYEPEPDDNNNYPDDDDDHDSSSSKPDIPPPTPNIIVSTYDYGGGNVTAAGNFTLTMTLMNTSKRVNVDNVVMKLSVPEAFTLTSSSNTFYIERIAKRSSVERTVNLSVKPNADAISHPIKVSFTYESVINDERKQFSAEQDISIPVSQLDRFSLNPVEMPSEIYVGEDSSIEATFVNKGKSTVYNVTAEITGNLSQPGQRQFIGNVESGKEESADFLIGALEAGTISGEVVISYEDANMNVNELRSPFTTTAVSFEMPAPDPGLDVMNPDDIGEAPPEPWYQKIPVWGWTTGGVTAIILLSFAAKAMRRHRELKLLEDSDEDF